MVSELEGKDIRLNEQLRAQPALEFALYIYPGYEGLVSDAVGCPHDDPRRLAINRPPPQKLRHRIAIVRLHAP